MTSVMIFTNVWFDGLLSVTRGIATYCHAVDGPPPKLVHPGPSTAAVIGPPLPRIVPLLETLHAGRGNVSGKGGPSAAPYMVLGGPYFLLWLVRGDQVSAVDGPGGPILGGPIIV